MITTAPHGAHILKNAMAAEKLFAWDVAEYSAK
jgi:hypothetical protein